LQQTIAQIGKGSATDTDEAHITGSHPEAERAQPFAIQWLMSAICGIPILRMAELSQTLDSGMIIELCHK
jgi:hypothetical protein